MSPRRVHFAEPSVLLLQQAELNSQRHIRQIWGSVISSKNLTYVLQKDIIQRRYYARNFDCLYVYAKSLAK